jgi:hypothetical protein
LQHTIDIFLTISIDKLSIIKPWVDASNAIQPILCSHTGGAIMVGKGVLYSKSSKQKLNTKLSTKAKHVGASDLLLHTLWTSNYIEAQDCTIVTNEFFQGNMGAMKMEQNGQFILATIIKLYSFFWISCVI